MGRDGEQDAHASASGVKEFDGFGALMHDEKRWRDRYFYLKDGGYTLRPRYHPKWKPSWLGTGLDPDLFEDCANSLEGEVLDAVRTVDNHRVSIKIVSNASQEIKIACLLSTKELLPDPRNHCVPVLDVLPDPLSPSHSLLIMPYLRPFYDPAFEVVEDIMDFIQQTLELLGSVFYPQSRGCSSGLLNDEHHDGRSPAIPR